MNEWYAFWALEPWGEVRADHRSGLIAAMVLNSQGAKNKGRPWQSSDFFTLYGANTKPQQSGETMLAFMRSFAEKHNGKTPKGVR
jgi:hypothetical protein